MLVVAANRMVRSTIRCGSEAEFLTISKLHKDCWLMPAGDDVGPAFDIIDSVKRKLNGEDRLSVDEGESAVLASHREKRALGCST